MQVYDFINAYLQGYNSCIENCTSATPAGTEDDIFSALYKNIEEAERIHASMRRHCWVLSMDSAHKICKYFNVDVLGENATLMGYKVKCSSLLPENTIIFGEFLWEDEDEPLIKS